MTATDPPPILPTRVARGARPRGRRENDIFDYRRPTRVERTQEPIELDRTLKLLRDPEKFAPFSEPGLMGDIKRIHSPDSMRMKGALTSLVLCVIFLGMFLLEINRQLSLFFSLSCFAFSTWILLRHSKSRTPPPVPEEPEPISETPKTLSQSTRPASERFKKRTEKRDTPKPETIAVPEAEFDVLTYRKADRVSSSAYGEGVTERWSTPLVLGELDILSDVFNKYVNEMKMFIITHLLRKLVQEHAKEERLVMDMLKIPEYEHAWEKYVLKRVRELSGSEYIASQVEEREDEAKNKEFPSDNQIILHILGVWLSFFMNGRKPGRSSLFAQKFLSIEKDPEVTEDEGIWLCTYDWSQFFVVTKRPRQDRKEWRLSPGSNAMYEGLTLFFWFVKRDYDFILNGMDLDDEPLCMRQIFEART